MCLDVCGVDTGFVGRERGTGAQMRLKPEESVLTLRWVPQGTCTSDWDRLYSSVAPCLRHVAVGSIQGDPSPGSRGEAVIRVPKE